MPQSTNLNVSPYYDDFDDEKNYHRVLFKPGVTVQTRELNNLQSILQNQIEKFGSKFFTNGGIVIPGNFGYDNTYNCIEIENSFKGILVESYFENFVGKLLKGKTTGIIAKVDYVMSKTDADSKRNTTALFVKYQNSSSGDFTTSIFENGEELITIEDVIVGSTLFAADTSVFRVLSPTEGFASSVGSAAKIEDGIYFIRGNFVNVHKSTIILDAYSNTPSYRVGLRVTESIIDSDEDQTLVDNSKGFSNYAAPGADRLKIECTLTKKELDDYNDDNFIELFRVEYGILRKINQNDPYAFITEVLARRTYDESGNYYVQPFKVTSLESLNDNLGNGGQYLSTQKTLKGETPSDDLAIIKVSPGKAYVKGYEVATTTELVDYPKPRTTKSVDSSSSSFNAGNVLKLNNIHGIPAVSITTNQSIYLYKTRLDSGNAVTSADQIGVSKIYDFEYDNTSYENQASLSNLYLFDIQTYTNVTTSAVNSGISTGVYVQGQYSDASGYVKNFNGSNINLYQVSGQFLQNEPIIISGISTTTTLTSVIDYSIQDIKSVSDQSSTFTADSALIDESIIDGVFNITVSGSTATIVRQDGTSFANGLKINDIISYSNPTQSLPVYARISSISSLSNIGITSISSVSNVCSSNLGSTGTLNKISVIRPSLNRYNDSEFYCPLENSSVSEVSFLNSSIFVKKYYDGLLIDSNSLTLPTLQNTDYVYSQFDEERYCLVNSDTGENINLTPENLSLSVGGKDGSLINLSVTSSNAKLIATQIKSNVSSKYKKLQRCSSILVSRSKYNPAASGLTYSKIYGTRIEDQEISLNRPDIFEVHGVFQSNTSSDPQLPSLTMSGLNSSNIIVGEVFVGETSGAVAICVEVNSNTNISFIYKSKTIFSFGETIKFKESGSSATVINLVSGNDNILSEFIVDNGQRNYFYDIGRLVRKEISREPSNKLKIVFDYFKFETTDSGDVVSVNSYPPTLYGKKIASFNGIRNTDIIDIRPRVSDYNPSTATLSPFEYGSRSFTDSYNNSLNVLKSSESILFDYKFYLPRSDKLTLNQDGEFEIIFGEPSQDPKLPNTSVEVLDVANIYSSAYVYDVEKDIKIDLINHRRYTMSDIRDIEKRVENLELYTSLSLLEVSTQNLLIEDNQGFNRFKSGFFVDNFSSYDVADSSNVSFNAQIANNTLSAKTEKTYVNLEIATSQNISFTKDSLILNYSEVEYQSQPFASRVVNVNPFSITTWSGNLSLIPKEDKWSIQINSQSRVANVSLRGTSAETRNRTSIRYIRSRNVEFVATRLKPITLFEFLFDSKNLSDNSLETTYAFPKLVEIKNVTGAFQVGEVVKGYNYSTKTNEVTFRICTPNHKSGPYNSPTTTYNINPYDPSTRLSSAYGPESTILNVDTETLNNNQNEQFFGNITLDMQLVGQSSGASAVVKDVRLISDDNGTLIGSFFIPNPELSSIKYETGNTTAKISASQDDPTVVGEFVSAAESNFTSEGTAVQVNRVTYYDPLAQTFLVPDSEGVFITSVDVFFQSKDLSIPVELQIREVSSGIPGGPDKVVESLSKVLLPNQINVSSDGSVPTTFTFDTPARLEGDREYSIVLLSDSDSYNVWVSRLGEVEISTSSLPEIQKVIINKQPSLGSLFKSQNGTTWVPVAEEDLKYKLNRAEFVKTSGSVVLRNTEIDVETYRNKLPNNPIIGLSQSYPAPYNDGRHIMVYHPNHGMYSENNYVEISGIEPDGLPVDLTQELSNTSSGPIYILSSSGFDVFNGNLVDSIYNPGYVKINNEIIKYTSISGNSLVIPSGGRGQFGTKEVTHAVNSPVYKYEFNGVSLSAINTVFTSIIDPTLNHYYVQIPYNYEGFPIDKFGGGPNAYASKNVQFSRLEFENNFITNYPSTSVNASVRTVSSTSVDGTEISFVDNGYQSVGINSINVFDTPRMVCSRQNELEYLPESQFPSNKSLSVELAISTSNSKISPVIDRSIAGVFLDNYIINSPIDLDSYSTDSRINSNINDPNAFIYVSKKINLSNPANSLKVLLSAYRHVSSDIRVLYKIFRDDSPDEDQNWALFPGYLNLDNNGNIIDSNNNDGRSDEFVGESLTNEYRDYTFSIDNTAQFTGFAIKIVGSSTNQAKSPLIKDLRVIALK